MTLGATRSRPVVATASVVSGASPACSTDGRLIGYRSPGRRATRDKLRAMAAPPVAVNCPDIFAEDREFMRLFRESKRAESLGQRDKLNRLITQLKSRGAWLEKQAKESTNAA